ncbi:heterokaryon incompatibility protein-domain-containing protein [Dendryphion nanum]|uniref:Heterokaryon incompatibility protein-domain-containing protein n=1 Tax=Dendryphion nanum TaxID=256645 RepID=A0A9P9DHV2_9PLEO|nr:heterokaryon incompatibility protein-domain-containing protein [Dendryphion nanum]
MEHVQFTRGEQFYYEPIPYDSKTIRLLTLYPGSPKEDIACHLEVVSLDSNPQYETLSYAWGCQELVKPIYLNNQPVRITENLHAALQHLRLQDDCLCLWVDAICIDQKNLSERSAQVAMMRDIYRSSTRVYVWLGTLHPTTTTSSGTNNTLSPVSRVDSGVDCSFGDEIWQSVGGSFAQSRSDMNMNTSNPFGLVEHFARDKHYYEMPGFQEPINGRTAILDVKPYLAMHEFLSETWWSRVWCVQEILLAPNAVLVYGSWRMNWDFLRLASINGRKHSVMNCCSATQMQMPAALWVFRDDDVVEKRLHYEGLNNLLRFYSHRHCQDPRDKVYGLLGLLDSTTGTRVIPDYTKSIQEVYHDVTMAIHLQNPSSLRFLFGTRGPQSSEFGLPSWTRDFSYTPPIATTWVEKHRINIYDLYQASKNSPSQVSFIDATQIKTRGTQVATITQVGSVRTNISFLESLHIIESWLQLAGLEIPRTLEAIQKPRHQQFWRTILGDLTLAFSPDLEYLWSRCDEATMQDYLETIVNFFNPGEDGGPVCKPNQPSLSKIILIATYEKALFLTDDGGMGLAYQGVKEGDEVWILEGGNTPFVLSRGEGKGRFTVAGDCYLDGFMDGQGMGGRVEEVVLV